MLSFRTWVTATLISAGVWGCGSSLLEENAEAAGGASASAFVRGRVVDVSGKALEGLEVVSDSLRVRTDSKGRFELAVPAGSEVQVAVESDVYSRAAFAVEASEDDPVQVEVAVKERKAMLLARAELGGRVEAADGFAVELPADALRDADDRPVRGEVRVKYALVKTSPDVVAVPGSMKRQDRKSLEGFGLAEVRFYQGDQRLRVDKAFKLDLPLHPEHRLSDGEEVDVYSMAKGDVRWQANARARVSGNKVVVRTEHDAWLGAARELPADSCVKGRLSLGAADKKAARKTTVRAARARGLSLVQAETSDDGSFCLPVTPDDDWNVSTYYDDGDKSYGLAVSVNSGEAAGMCGGDGCKSVGEVAIAPLP